MWLLKSSIGRKLIMSLSGLFLLLFLLIHMCMNLTSVFSAEVYNAVCDFMGTNPVIQVMVPVLAAGFVVHIAYALMLTLQNRKARGADKYASSNKSDVKWASKNMFVLGLLILGFLGLHLTHFWVKMQWPEWTGGHPEEGYKLVSELFRNPVYVGIYIVWVAALWFHLTHGFWSAFQTIGLDNKIWFPRLKMIANIYAAVIAIGFIIVPIFFGLGLDKYLH